MVNDQTIADIIAHEHLTIKDMSSLYEQIRNQNLDMLYKDDLDKVTVPSSHILINYLRSENRKQELTNMFAFGRSRSGKTLTLASFLNKLDPTFRENLEKRYIIGDQYEKAAAYYTENKMAGKAYFWDELGVAMFTEDHANRVVKSVVKLSQISGYKYSFFLGATTEPELIVSKVKNQFRFFFEVFKRNDAKKETIYQTREMTPMKHFKQYNSPERYYDERPIKIPGEFTEHTVFHGQQILLNKIRIHLPTQKFMREIKEVEERWKIQYSSRGADELKDMAKGKKTESDLDETAEKIFMDMDSYFYNTARTRRLNAEKVMADFAVLPREVNTIFMLVRKKCQLKGYKFDDLRK